MAASSGIIIWADGIKAELVRCLPGQRKTQRDKLAVLVATMRHVRSANLVELAAGLPRWSDRLDMGYQWISRFLESERGCCDTAMRPFAVDILARTAKPGDAIPLILDQSKLSDRHQVLMLSVRWGERALPLAWRVEETRRRHRRRDPKEPARRRANVAATGHASSCRPVLRNTRTDPPVPGARLGLPAASEEKSHHARRREAPGYRADVPRLQVARLRHRADPNPLSRPRRPPDPGDGACALLGGLHRHVGRRQKSLARRKDVRPSAPQSRRTWRSSRPHQPPGAQIMERSGKRRQHANRRQTCRRGVQRGAGQPEALVDDEVAGHGIATSSATASCRGPISSGTAATPRARSHADTRGSAVTTQNGTATSSPPANGSAQAAATQDADEAGEHHRRRTRVRPEHPRRLAPADAARRHGSAPASPAARPAPAAPWRASCAPAPPRPAAG